MNKENNSTQSDTATAVVMRRHGHKPVAKLKGASTMYRVYRVMRNQSGEIIHKTPLSRHAKLASATAHARVWANGWETIIVQLNADGTETQV